MDSEWVYSYFHDNFITNWILTSVDVIEYFTYVLVTVFRVLFNRFYDNLFKRIGNIGIKKRGERRGFMDMTISNISMRERNPSGQRLVKGDATSNRGAPGC